MFLRHFDILHLTYQLFSPPAEGLPLRSLGGVAAGGVAVGGSYYFFSC